MSMLNGTTTPKDSSSKQTNILSNSDVYGKVGFSSTTLWRRVGDGSFPPPIKLSSNRVGWIEYEVDAWIEQKAQER